MLDLLRERDIFSLTRLSLIRISFEHKLYLSELSRYFRISAMIIAVLVTKMVYAWGCELRWSI